MIKLREIEVDVDIEAELREYDWTRAKWTGEKLICCSPFRSEFRPSFAVHLETGVFIDSGGEDEWRKGHFVKLLSWLRNETWTETENYLLEKYYGIGFLATDELELDFSGWLEEEVKPEPIPLTVLDAYRYKHLYLEKERGIEPIYQRAVKIGYDPRTKAITIPIFNKDGELVNIKFRSVKGKQFWYYPSGQPVRNHLYCLHLVHLKQSKRVYLVESEIDALTLWKNGFPAVAVMGSALTDRQKRLILDSSIETIVLATDNDKAGKRLRRSITNKLNGLVNIEEMNFPEQYKDVNDIPTKELIYYAENSIDITW